MCSEPTRCATESLDRLVLQLVPCLQDLSVHLLHRVSELHAEAAENIALPHIVLRVHARLHLLIIDHTSAKRALRLRRVERRPRLLDFREQLLPVRERVAESVEDVFGFEVPKRLELQPLGDVLLELLYLVLDEDEGAFQGVVSEAGELKAMAVSTFQGTTIHKTHKRSVRCLRASSRLHLQADLIT